MWHLRCFGALKAERIGQSIERFRTQKTAALLALLALKGTQTRESLCAALWPDAVPEAARNSLSAALSSLRRDLGDDVLAADRQSVSLVRGMVTTDVAAFDTALKNKEFAVAVSLYAGHLLGGFHEDPFPALAGEYEEKARGAFCAHIEELERTSNADALRSMARRAIALFGDDERWFLALMRAHYFANDLDAALRAYDTLLRHARKTGEVASEEARQLAKTLRREKEQKEQFASKEQTAFPAVGGRLGGSSPLDELVPPTVVSKPAEPPVPVASAPLPSQWTRFFGREAERELLRAWLKRGEKLITLSGAGGSGKTRLAIETLVPEVKPNDATESASPVHFVPLSSLSDASLLFSSVRDALGLTIASDLPPQEQIARALNGTNSVLLLDNFEQLVPQGAAYLQSLREKLPDTTLMVTSRTLLRLPGEREFPVAPLPTPMQQMAVEDIAASPSVQLFSDRSGVQVNPENAQAIGALCRRLDGIPLALELAAARARLLSPAQILERLEKHPDFLQSRELGVPARHKTLRATIEWSAELLTSELRAFFTKLSVFRGGWTLEAAEVVCQEFDAIESLTLLRESSLVRVETGDGETRFRMLETLREFGQEHLSPDEKTAIERAFFDYYLQLAQQAAHAMRGPQQTLWLTRLDIEQDNVRAALAWARDNDAQRGLQLATALIDFWETRLSLQEGRTWIETFLRATAPKTQIKTRATALPEAPRLEVRSRALSGAGRLAWYSSDLTEADSYLEQGIETARSAGDSSSLIYATRTLARVTALAGDETRSQRLGSDAVQLARASNDPSLLLEALSDLGFAATNAGDFEAGAKACDEAIALARQLGDERALALALVTRAAIYDYEPDRQFAKAYALLDECEELCRRLNVPWELMVCLATRANVMRKQGNYAPAQEHFNEALVICRDGFLGSWNVVNVLCAVSYLFAARGDSEDAACLLGGADALAQALGYTMMPFLVAENTLHRETLHHALGEVLFKAAWERGHAMTPLQAVEFAMRSGSEPASSADKLAGDQSPLAMRARALSAAGRMASYSRELAASRALVEQGLDAARQSGDTASFVHAVTAFNYFSMTTGDLEGDMTRACALGEEAVALSRTFGEIGLLAEALYALGMARTVLGRYKEARSPVEESIALATNLGDEQRLSRALNLLATLTFYNGDEKTARSILDSSLPLCRRSGDVWDSMVSLSLLSAVAREQGDLSVAYDTIAEALHIARENPTFYWGVSNLVATMGFVLLRFGHAEKTARLMGAAEAIREASHYELIPFLVPEYNRYRAAAREVLGEDAFQSAWQQGHSLSNAEAIEDALGANTEAHLSDPTLLAMRAQALSGAGRLAWYSNDVTQADALLGQGLQSAQQAGDVTAIIYATRSLARVTALAGDMKGGQALGREAVQLARRLGNASVLYEALTDLAFAELNASDFASAALVGEEAVELARQIGEEHAIALALGTLAIIYYYQEEYPQVLACINECESICRRLDARWELVICTALRGRLYTLQGQFELAKACFNEAVALCWADGVVTWNMVNVLHSVAYGFYMRGDVADSVCLLAACEATSESIGYTLLPFIVPEQQEILRSARERLGDVRFEVAWTRGRAMTPEATIKFATHPDFDNGEANVELLAARARALSGAGRLASYGKEFAESKELVEQGLEAARRSGDPGSFVHAVGAYVRFATATGDEDVFARADELSLEAAERSRLCGNTTFLLESLIALMYARIAVLKFDGVRAAAAEAESIARALGDEQLLARVLSTLATVAFYEKQYDEARQLVAQSTPLCRRVNSPHDLLNALWVNSSAAREQGQFDVAAQDIKEALRLCREYSEYRWAGITMLIALGALTQRIGQPHATAIVSGAVWGISEAINYRLLPMLRPEYERNLAQSRQQLGSSAFQEAWNRGYAMTFEHVVEFALELEVPEAIDTAEVAMRARALSGAGRMASYGSDLGASRELVEQGLETARQSGNQASFIHAVAAFVSFSMTTSNGNGEMTRGCELSQEAVRLSRAMGDRSLLVESLIALSYSQMFIGALEGVRALLEEAISLARSSGDDQRLARASNCLTSLAFYEGDLDWASQLAEEGLALARRVGSPWDLIVALWMDACVNREQGSLVVAYASLCEALVISRENPDFRWGVSNLLVTMSYLAFRCGHAEEATLVMAASQALCEAANYNMVPLFVPEYTNFHTAIKASLSEAVFEALWRQGYRMTSEQAVEFALHLDLNQRLITEPNVTESTSTISSLESDRARALSAAGRLAWHGSEFEESKALIEQGLEAARHLGDIPAFVEAVAAFVRLAMTTGVAEGSLARARVLSEEAVQRCRALGDRSLLLESFNSLLYARMPANDLKGLGPIGDEALALAREVGDEQRLTRMLTCVASLRYYEGRLESSRELLVESVALSQRLNSPWDLTASLWAMSHTAREQGELDLAYDSIVESLNVGLETYGIQWPVVNVMLALSFVLVQLGEPAKAMQILGAAEKLTQTLNYDVTPALRVDYDRYCQMAKEMLGQEEFDVAWKRGRAMTPEQMVDYALNR